MVRAFPGVLATMNIAPLDVAGLVRVHQVGLWRYLRYLGCDACEAEDLCQEAFLTVLRAPFHDYDSAATGAYLRTLARHLFLKRRRRQARQPVHQDLDQADAVWQRIAGEDDARGWLAALQHCLPALTERVRWAVELRYRDSKSREAIGVELRMSSDGVKSLLRRARASLRECIERRVGR